MNTAPKMNGIIMIESILEAEKISLGLDRTEEKAYY